MTVVKNLIKVNTLHHRHAGDAHKHTGTERHALVSGSAIGNSLPPRRFFLLDEGCRQQLVFHTHTHPPTHTHILFAHCLPFSSVPAHNGHTPIKMFSIGNAFKEKQSSLPCWLCSIGDGLLRSSSFCFSWAWCYIQNTAVIAPLGLSLTGFITLTLPRFNSQSPDWKENFLCWCENCLFALVHNKLVISSLMVNGFPECHVPISARRLYPCIHSASRYGLKCTFYLLVSFSILGILKKGRLQCRGGRDANTKQRHAPGAQSPPPSCHHANQTSFNKTIFPLSSQFIVYRAMCWNLSRQPPHD